MSQTAYNVYSALAMPGQFADDGDHQVLSFNAQEPIPPGSGVVRGATDTTCRLPSGNISTITFGSNFITDNTINLNVNGVAMSQVTFTTDNATTLALIASTIDAMAGVSAVTSGSHSVVVTSDNPANPVYITGVVVADGDVPPTSTVVSTTAIVFAGDFVTSNVINLKVNTVSMTPVTFATDNATTLAAIATNISAMSNVSAVTSGAHTIIVSSTNPLVAPSVTNIVVTSGASQTTGTATSTTKVTFSANFIGGETINLKVNAVAMSQVTFTTDNATTLAAIATAISTMSNVSAVTSGSHAVVVSSTDPLVAPAVTEVVVLDATPSNASISVTTSDIFIGIAAQEHTLTQGYQTGIVQYATGATVAVLSRGRIAVRVEEDVLTSDAVYLRDSVDGAKVRGAWRKDTDTGAFLISRARYMTRATAGTLTVLEVNLP